MSLLLQSDGTLDYCNYKRPALFSNGTCDKSRSVKAIYVHAVLCSMHDGKKGNDKVNDMSHSQMLGKVESGGGPIFKVVLEC